MASNLVLTLNTTWTKIETTPIDDLGVDEISANNIEIDLTMFHRHNAPVASNSFGLGGEWFVTFAGMPFYHVLVDNIGTFEILKKRHPNIQMLILTMTPIEEASCANIWEHVINKYSPKIINVLQDCGRIHIESAYTILSIAHRPKSFNQEANIFSGILDKIRGKYIDAGSAYSMQSRIVMLRHAIDSLSADFKPNSIVSGKKIYSARNRKKYKKISSDEMRLDNQVFHSRKYTEEERLIKYFEGNGFEIVYFDELSLEEQIQKSSEASVFVGTKGSNMINAMYMQPGSVAIGIHTVNWWDYQFEEYLRDAGIKYYEINSKIVYAKPNTVSKAISKLIPLEQANVFDLIDEADGLNAINGWW